jgi:hypothetical protein
MKLRSALFRASDAHLQARVVCWPKCQKTWQLERKAYFSAMWPQLRRNEAVNNLSKPSCLSTVFAESGSERDQAPAQGNKHGSFIADFAS